MLEVDMKTAIKTLYQKGYKMRDIDRKTVRKVLKDDAGRKETGQGSAWPSMLDAYREYIEIQLGKELSITRIH